MIQDQNPDQPSEETKAVAVIVETNRNVPVPRADIISASMVVLSPEEVVALENYMKAGGHELSSEAVSRFFELYLNGSDCREIHRLNKPFPYESILWAKVKYHWDYHKDQSFLQRQLMIKDKFMRAQLDATDLVSDILVAARKKHGDKLKKYIQTGNEADLGGAIGIDSLHSLLKTVEGLIKITGQDRTITNRTVREDKQTLSVNVNANVQGATEVLGPDDAAKILSVVADAKRKKQHVKPEE